MSTLKGIVPLPRKWIPMISLEEISATGPSWWPPWPPIPVAPNVLHFRDRELVHILGHLVWFETNRGHMIIQDTQDSHGPRDPESVRQAIVDLRDNMGSAHCSLFGMQNMMDGHQVEQVKMEDMMKEMSVCLQQLEKCFEMSIPDEWAFFQLTILQSLSTVAFAGQACLQSHAAYQPPPSSLAARLNVVCAKLQGLRVSLDSPESSRGPPSSSPAPPPSPLPLPPSKFRSTRGVGVNSPPSGWMGVKYLKAPYSRRTCVTKQTCTSQDLKKVLWFHTSNFFKKMQQDHRVLETQNAFKRVLDTGGKGTWILVGTC